MKRTTSGEHPAVKERDLMAAKGFLPVAEVAKRTGKSVYAIYGWIESGRLKDSVKVDTHHYVLWSEVLTLYREEDPKAVELLGLTEKV